MTATHRRLLILGLLACALLTAGRAGAAMSAAARTRMQASGRVGADLVAALEAADRVTVVVAFALPGGVRPHQLATEHRRRAIADARAPILAALSAKNFELTHAYASIDAFAGRITTDGVLTLLDRPEIVRVDADIPMRVQLNESLPLMKVSNVKASGYTGSGVTVAVIDTGIDTNHPDLADDLVGEACFCTACCPTGPHPQFGPGSAEDDNGHGTRVSGIITGRGTIAPQGGAPDANVLAIKAFDATGFGFSSNATAGLDYIIESHPEVKVVNMSFGGGSSPGECDATSGPGLAQKEAIHLLVARGTTLFAAAGNESSGTGMNSPACISKVISVGAVWDTNTTDFDCTPSAPAFPDSVACYSNSNATTDVFAPGGLVTSTAMGGGSTTGSGTSFATPATAACAADLLQAKPLLTSKEIELAMEASPTIVTNPRNGLSFPRVDCLHALGVAGIESSTPIAATVALVKPGQLVKLVARGTFTLPDPDIDNPVFEGGTLTFAGTTGGQSFTLPATCWKALGADGTQGYKCRNAGPCRTVIVKERVIKAICAETGDFGPLPEPGPVEFVLTVGTGTRYCAECGGSPAGDPNVLFKQRDCAAPSTCP